MACVTQRFSTISYSQTCNQCGQPLQGPPEARLLQCTTCQTLNPVRPTNRVSRIEDQVHKTAGRVKGYLQQVSNNITSSINSSYRSSPSYGHSNYYSGSPYSGPPLSHSYGFVESNQSYGSSPKPHQGTVVTYSYSNVETTHQGSPSPHVYGSSPNSHHGALVSQSYGGMHSSPYSSGGVQQSYGAYNMSMSPACPPAHGKKRAVLCGVSYRYRRNELRGTVNDVNCMKYLLKDKFGFAEECILVLTEDERNQCRVPTKENIRKALRWLVHGCQAGDSLVFHFSGHGSQQVDVNDDEADGFDEALCPMDYETEGMIIDDEINETIVRPLPKGAKLHAIIDACHSGTVLDLPFVCQMNRTGFYQWENQSLGMYKGTSGGLAISFSSCDDDQTSADTSAFSMNTTTGAMTYCFIQAVECQPGLTYGRLLSSMRSAIREAQTGIRASGPIASLLRKMLRAGLTQEPQLSASEQFDVYRMPFLL